MSDDGRLGFELPPVRAGHVPAEVEVKLSRTQRATAKNRRLLAEGTHPATGAPVLDGWGFTCADCTHLHRIHHHTRTYLKCSEHRLGMSRSEASDIRSSWPACARLRITGR